MAKPQEPKPDPPQEPTDPREPARTQEQQQNPDPPAVDEPAKTQEQQEEGLSWLWLASRAAMAFRIGRVVIAVTEGRLIVRRARYKVMAVLWARTPAMMRPGFVPRTQAVDFSEQ